MKGTGALKRLFMGSTTLSIVNESNLLTLAVPVREAKAMPKKLSDCGASQILIEHYSVSCHAISFFKPNEGAGIFHYS
ncbi:MAG: hypothetical protein U5L96_06630 [Owenweeksia sp.]|nr:hypothetical protein [Owenweeksia sp.]